MEQSLVKVKSKEIKEIEKLLGEGDRLITIKTKKSALLLGCTGAGKSTLMALIADRNLKGIELDSGDLALDLADQRDKITLNIGHNSKSCTSLPNFYEDEECSYWDCPGFEDNKSVAQEIANVYYTKKLFENSDQQKFILVIPFGLEKPSRGQLLADLFEILCNLIPDKNALFDGLTIIISKCPSRYKKEHFIKSVTELTEENNRFQENLDIFARIINSPHKIALFKMPNENMEVDKSDRIRVMESIRQSTFVRTSPKCGLGRAARLYISNLVGNYQIKVLDKMHQLKQNLEIKFNLERDLKVLNKIKGILDSITMNQITDLDSFESSLTLLTQFANELPNDVNIVKNLIFRLRFYQEYNECHQNPFNFTAWIEPLNQLRLLIEQTINIANQEEREKQANEYEIQHRREIEQLNEQNLKLRKEIDYIKATNTQILMQKELIEKLEMNQSQAREFQNQMLVKITEILNRPINIYGGGRKCITF